MAKVSLTINEMSTENDYDEKLLKVFVINTPKNLVHLQII